ncbi:ABC transporter permease [Microbacterium sp. EYE_5]|uniref:ABC transporter permease n=1 Tax=unclassified Microbacterium TaxID=2609290 RepID=UPI0020051E10|nr:MULTISPECIES: ABC transporter permease [unclassified Microbacterium]MCK6081628.1 ABC transporter permease [Microbacterium sp. EYE_382]MCK6086898.1 ABC transporter permease [Microbacterium sp. EYE_384]MCK6123604.1 ABC transporter permease [Microbacterium sp. EYE_80]MCK6126513.1 ABC transporter permease [Microbacterium sp. EYE_79]MCK6142582.1 ABC transporter permease [Microbacterium sp. EYE_39]
MILRRLPSALLESVVRTPLLVILIVLVVGVQLATDAFFGWSNIRGILQDSAVIAIVAVPVAMLLIAGYIDLSVGSTLALGGVVASLVMDKGAGNPALAVLLAILAGAAVGLINAFVVVVLGLNSFITTLGTLTAVRGVAQLVSPVPRNNFGDQFGLLGVGTLAGIPFSVWIAAAVLMIAAVFLSLTPAGRHVFAIGVNREAAYLSGVRVKVLPFWLFGLSGAMAGFAGTIVVARLNSAPAGQIGAGFELVVLTAVLLGGVALTGGEGGIFGVIVGVLFYGALNNSLVLLGVTTFWQAVASGVALVAAIGLSSMTHVLRVRLAAARARRLAAA